LLPVILPLYGVSLDVGLQIPQDTGQDSLSQSSTQSFLSAKATGQQTSVSAHCLGGLAETSNQFTVGYESLIHEHVLLLLNMNVLSELRHLDSYLQSTDPGVKRQSTRTAQRRQQLA